MTQRARYSDRYFADHHHKSLTRLTLESSQLVQMNCILFRNPVEQCPWVAVIQAIATEAPPLKR